MALMSAEAGEADGFVKRRVHGPGFFAWEAAGLRWLGEASADGGARVVGVRAADENHIELDRVAGAPATPRAAEEFGRALAVTHAAGAGAFGVGPPGWRGGGYIGRQVLPLEAFGHWGECYAELRLLPYARAARDAGTLDGGGVALVERVCARLAAGEFDDGRPPARIHGDLWGGNLLYASTGAVLIDPAAHGGHGQTDLAMLALFGTPHLERVEAAYAEAARLPAGWPERTGLHQLHPLLVHAVTHGPSYGHEAVRVARRYA